MPDTFPLFPRARFQVVLVEVEQHIGYIHDHSPGCVARFQDHVELLLICSVLLNSVNPCQNLSKNHSHFSARLTICEAIQLLPFRATSTGM